MSDVDWENYAKELLEKIQKNQDWCNAMRRKADLTQNERDIIDSIDITNDNIKLAHIFAKNIGNVLARVDDDQINSKSQINAINNSIGLMCKRLDKLEDK